MLTLHSQQPSVSMNTIIDSPALLEHVRIVGYTVYGSYLTRYLSAKHLTKRVPLTELSARLSHDYCWLDPNGSMTAQCPIVTVFNGFKLSKAADGSTAHLARLSNA